MNAEFVRNLALAEIGAGVSRSIEASEPERAALARRFDLRELAGLAAAFDVTRVAGGIRVGGRVTAVAIQACAISGEDVAAQIDEPVNLFLVHEAANGEAEIELDSGSCDILPLDGPSIDLGELAAQSLGLALDPYPRAEAAKLAAARDLLVSEEEARAAANPFSALKNR